MRRYVGIDYGRKALGGGGRLEYRCAIMDGESCLGLAVACLLDKGS